MNALPQPIANGRNQNGTIAGKLNGTIAAHTPTGWRIVSQSTPRATSSRMRPCIVVGIAHAHSTISIIRATSARASAIVLPISVVTERARSSLRGLEALAQREQHPRSVDRRDRAPHGQRGARRRDRGVQLGGARQRDVRQHRAGAGLITSSVSVGARARRPTRRRRSCRADGLPWRLLSSGISWGLLSAAAAGSPAPRVVRIVVEGPARFGPAITLR